MKDHLYKTLSPECNYGVKYYTFLYNELPNSRVYFFELNVEVFLNLLKDAYPNYKNLSFNKYFYSLNAKPEWRLNRNSMHLELKEKMFIHYESGSLVLSFSQSADLQEIETLDALLLNSRIVEKEKPRQFYMIKKQDYGSYELAEFNAKNWEVNLSENYNDDLLQLNEKLIKFITAEDQTGVILLHGLPGAGKTSYIRHLISCCSTRFIYMPNTIVKQISQPDFISFISSFPGSVLVLEDGEEIVGHRENNPSFSGITNLLSLGDGLLGDALKLKIICTFNCELKKVDKALLRPGRLKFRYEFGKLLPEKVDFLYKKLNLKNQEKGSKTLAEIYHPNQLEENLQSDKSIGFKKN